MAAVLLMLAARGYVEGLTILPAAVILCRELIVSGLREFLAELRVGVPVSHLAKWKTVLRMVSIGFLLTAEAGPDFGPLTTLEVGALGLWGAAVLTLITGYDYLRAGLRHLGAPGGENGEQRAE